jgi:hypothetical protein
MPARQEEEEEQQQRSKKIGEWNQEESFAAFQGHVDNNDISKEDLMRLRPWHTMPWHPNPHKSKLSVGDVAPDSQLVTLQGYDTTMSSILEQDERPVVLVFGSITCPPFRSLFLKEICEIVEEHKGALRLVLVYLAEAHPKDGWHLGVNDKHEVVVQQHATIDERIASANELVQRFAPDSTTGGGVVGLEEVVVDSMDNNTDQRYEAQSSRIYVIHEKKIVYQSEVGPFQISPSSLQAFLWEWPVLLKTNKNTKESDAQDYTKVNEEEEQEEQEEQVS